MMNKKRPFFLLAMLSAITICVILLLIFANNHNQTAYADGLQAQPAPRDIFVDQLCGTSVSGAAQTPTPDPAQHDYNRFGNETSHYYQFLGKSGNVYTITTDIFTMDANSVSIDTKLLLYRDNPINSGEQPIAINDDRPATGTNPAYNPHADPYESEIGFQATEDRYYWIEVQNLVRDGNGTYCIQAERSPAMITNNGPDNCENNNSIDAACEIQLSVSKASEAVPMPLIFPPPTVKPVDANQYLVSYPEYNFRSPIEHQEDLDFYKLWVKAGENYICQTFWLSPANDTNLIFYKGDGTDFIPNKGNDDIAPGDRASRVSVTVDYTGWLNILVNPVVEVDPHRASEYTYRLICVNELDPNPNQTILGGSGVDPKLPDICEVNNSFDLASACQVQLLNNSGKITGALPSNDPANNGRLNFAPFGTGIRDVDYFKLWSKAGWAYSCYTTDLINGNDTKMTMYYADNGALTPGDNPNDDYQPDVSLASKVEISLANTRTGWLIIKVEPTMSEITNNGGDYQYKLTCEAHPPPGASLTNLNSPSTIWDATRVPSAVTPTPQGSSAVPLTSTPLAIAAASGAVTYVALPSPIPTPAVAQQTELTSFTVQIYYDANNNHSKDENEGVANMPVYVHTGLSDTPIETVTTEGGAIFVSTEMAADRVQLIVPYLNINQELSVMDNQDIRLRVAP